MTLGQVIEWLVDNDWSMNWDGNYWKSVNCGDKLQSVKTYQVVLKYDMVILESCVRAKEDLGEPIWYLLGEAPYKEVLFTNEGRLKIGIQTLGITHIVKRKSHVYH